MPGPDYILDIHGLVTPAAQDSVGGTASKAGARPWIAVKWTCCSVYSRIYRHREGDRYEGRCPKCMKQATARVGPGGTSRRFFEAG
jgi:hypothetical protein